MKKLKWCECVSFVCKMILLYFLSLLLLSSSCGKAQTIVPLSENDTSNSTDYSNLLYETLEINSSKVMYNNDVEEEHDEITSPSTFIPNVIAATTTIASHLDVYLNDEAGVGATTKELLKKIINGTDSSLLSKNLTTWPTKHVANVEGDIILGGLMMVHEREEEVICGPIMAQGGIQALETMLFTLDYINGAGLLPNISIGAHILDDCDKGKCFCRFGFFYVVYFFGVSEHLFVTL